jgi:tetratricopeptide (TPR) repeat protein
MDCEKFESAMMDELYGELDELTSAAAKRHVAGCVRCAALVGGLRATRRVASMPLVDPPADLEERILAAVREAQRAAPLRGRVARAVSLAGSWAMRPQTAMAALFLVMIGTSVLLLRGKSSHAPPSEDVTVTERGAPALEPLPTTAAASAAADPASALVGSAAALARPLEGKPAISPAPGELAGDLRAAHSKSGSAALPPAPQAGASLSGPAPMGGQGGWAQQAAAPADKRQDPSPFDAALQSYRAGRFDDAARSFDGLAAADPNADLWAARAVRESKGCRNAVARFDKVARRASGTPPGWDALLEGALCYRALGDFSKARVYLTALLTVDSHKDRARAELDRINQLQQPQGTTAPAAAAAARPSPKRAAIPQATAVEKAAEQ